MSIHSSRCTGAEGDICHCWCHHAFHGSTAGFKSKSARRKVIKSIATATAVAGTVGAIAATGGTAAMFIPPLYKAYSAAKFGTAVFDILNNWDKANSLSLNKGEETVKTQIISGAADTVTMQNATQTADNIVRMAQSSGALGRIALATNVDPDLLGSMLEGSISQGLQTGIGSLAALA